MKRILRLRPALTVTSLLWLALAAIPLVPAVARAASMERAVATDQGPTNRRAVVEPAPAFQPNADERRIFALVNIERARAHLPPVEWDDGLARIARAHSAEMKARSRLDHRSAATGATPMDRARAAGLRPGLFLENIAKAYSADQANLALMMSPGHRRNILHPDVRRIGVGVEVRQLADGDRQMWVTQDFSRDLPPLDDDTSVRARDNVLGWYRERGRALSEDPSLSGMAQAMADLAADGQSPLALPFGNRNDFGRASSYHALQVVTVRTADPDHLGELPAPMEAMATSYGIGLAVEPEGRSERNVCVVIVLGGR